MGEIAEAMLDGTLCAGCGEYLGTDAGFPIYCGGCAPHFPDAQFEEDERKPSKPARYNAETKVAKPFSCQVDGCGKRFATQAAKRAHRRMKHALPETGVVVGMLGGSNV